MKKDLKNWFFDELERNVSASPDESARAVVDSENVLTERTGSTVLQGFVREIGLLFGMVQGLLLGGLPQGANQGHRSCGRRASVRDIVSRRSTRHPSGARPARRCGSRSLRSGSAQERDRELCRMEEREDAEMSLVHLSIILPVVIAMAVIDLLDLDKKKDK